MRGLALHHETIETRSRVEMIDITERVARLVRQRNLHEGMVVLYVPHTTASITINENADPDVKSDILKKLERLVPQIEPYYDHAEGNSDAHVKAALVGNSGMVLVENGSLVLGRWQGIYFCEFDGPRERRLNIKLVSFRDEQPGST